MIGFVHEYTGWNPMNTYNFHIMFPAAVHETKRRSDEFARASTVRCSVLFTTKSCRAVQFQRENEQQPQLMNVVKIWQNFTNSLL